MQQMTQEKIDFEEYAKNNRFYGISEFPTDLESLIKKLKSHFKEINFLDIGVGDGDFVESLLKKFSINVSVSDISKIRLERTEKRLGSEIKNYIQDDICNSKIKSDTFEFINSDQVIEHVPSDEKMAYEIKRILKKNGIFRVSSVYKKKWAWYFYRCNNKWVLDPTHLREYTSTEEYKNLFTNQGLKILNLKLEKVYFPLIDFVLRRLKIDNIEKFQLLRKIKIRIFGYYRITVIGEK